MYICRYTYINTHIYPTYTLAHTQKVTLSHKNIKIHIHRYKYTHIQLYIQMHVPTCNHADTCPFVPVLHTDVHRLTYTHKSE